METGVIRKYIENYLENNRGMDPSSANYIEAATLLVMLAILCWLISFIGKRWLHYFVPKFTGKTKTAWDDVMLNEKVLNAFSHLLPAIIFDHYAPGVFKDYPVVVPYVLGVTDIFIIAVGTEIVNSFLTSVKEILSENPKYKDKPIGSFTQLGQMLTYGVAIILIISTLIGKSPLYLLSGLGAMAAVLLLVFRDSLLGFMASLQLSANDMVRIGDWVTVPKYGADGDVIEINLTTIKVQNFDKTITTIPTYAFISDSFTNWRGMSESDGRRIKRSLNIKMESVKFCSPEMVEQFKKFQIIKEYLENRSEEIQQFNEGNKVDKSELINGRHLTNLGVLRVYIEEYLKHNPNINTNMTLMVRQLAPTEFGVPLEIYAFTKSKEWIKYEQVLSDVFDHVIAAVPYFELHVFDRPSGTDFKAPK